MTTDKLTWTKDKPTVAGFYWTRVGREAYMYEVVLIDGRPAVATRGGTGSRIDVQGMSGVEWAGPIPEPREPEEVVEQHKFSFLDFSIMEKTVCKQVMADFMAAYPGVKKMYEDLQKEARHGCPFDETLVSGGAK